MTCSTFDIVRGTVCCHPTDLISYQRPFPAHSFSPILNFKLPEVTSRDLGVGVMINKKTVLGQFFITVGYGGCLLCFHGHSAHDSTVDTAL